jgi:hypothetical protein
MGFDVRYIKKVIMDFHDDLFTFWQPNWLRIILSSGKSSTGRTA